MAMLKPMQISRQTPTKVILAGIFLAGTGGVLSTPHIPFGYTPPGLRDTEAGSRSPSIREQLRDVIKSLQTTNSNVARALGVSRQTIYNWLRGDIPNRRAQQTIAQLSRASDLLRDSGISPKVALSQPAFGGRNFWALLGEGKDPERLTAQIISTHRGRQPQRSLVAARMAEKRARNTLRRDTRDDLG